MWKEGFVNSLPANSLAESEKTFEADGAGLYDRSPVHNPFAVDEIGEVRCNRWMDEPDR